MPGAMSLSERLSTERPPNQSVQQCNVASVASSRPTREPPMVSAPAKTGPSNSGSLPDILTQLGQDVRARLVSSSRSSNVAPEISELEGRLKARLDAHGQRLAALEQASRAVEGSTHTASRVGSQMAALHAAVQNVARENQLRRSPGRSGESPAAIADSPLKSGGGGTVTPPLTDDALRAEIQSDITRHLELLRTEVEEVLVGDFASKLDSLRQDVNRRFSEMRAELESVAQGRPSGMPVLALPPQATEMEKAAWSEGWRAGQLKALEATSPEFGPSDRMRPQLQPSSSRLSESSSHQSSHPLMSAIEPSPNRNSGRRSLVDDSSPDHDPAPKLSSRGSGDWQEGGAVLREESRRSRDKHWL